MLLYHGTNRTAAQNIVGPPQNVNVTLGCGELGRGFYTGENVALAIRWAVGRYGRQQACVVVIDIDDGDYVSLNVVTLNHARVLNTWVQLQYNSTVCTYLFNVDVVYGPLATYPHAAQHKFESLKAQNVLNNRAVLSIIP